MQDEYEEVVPPASVGDGLTVLKMGGRDGRFVVGVTGRYLKGFDFEFDQGRGRGVFTDDINDALRFESGSEALRYYATTPKCRPERPDGKPNRPLSATTVEFVRIVKKGSGGEVK